MNQNMLKTSSVRIKTYLISVRLCSTKSKSNKKWSSTVLLPRTTFSQRLEGEKRLKVDNDIIRSKDFQSVYEKQMSRSETKQSWVLHDGPPYANGPAHMGHAVNKILKDITNRWKVSHGCQVHYVPGWDCHGLPIELKALQKGKSRNKDPLSVRQMSRNFALEAIQGQKEEFVSWGIMADWSRPYLTMDKNFIQSQLRLFYDLMKKGHIYQRFMPVYWSPSSQTALAESELEYNANHISTSIYIRFPIIPESVPDSWSNWKNDLFALSWTTTPWSLAANRAIVYKKDAEYVIVQNADGEKYVIAKELLESSDELKNIFGESSVILATFANEDAELIFHKLKYQHPLRDDLTMGFYPASHVTLTAGTGLVHTAPGHGQEDYLVGLQHGLDLSCPVNELGKYDANVLMKELHGLEVLGQGNDKMLELLHDKGHILKQTKFEHSYPYDWRTKKPVILRGSKQWFMDARSLQKKAMEFVEKEIKIHPQNMTKGFESVLQSRPYWCISRQRVWGVPIPVFYDCNQEPLTNQSIIDKLCDIVEQTGSIDFWWKSSEQEILDGLDLNAKNLTKGKDILDVWFDSGITWNAVVPVEHSGKQVCDLYLEGLDQFSGWFYSSLLTSIAAQETPSFKNIFVHGFTLDENGKKMSKSLGNVVAPAQIIKGSKSGSGAKGVDVLRYWVAAHASQASAVYVSDNLMQATKLEVDRIRNNLRFLIANLPDDFQVINDVKSLKKVDQFILHQLRQHHVNICRLYESLAFNKVCLQTQNFFAQDLSGFYLFIIKDRLYCDSKDSFGRQSALTAIYWHLKYLSNSLRPILPVLSTEIGIHKPSMKIDLSATFDDSESANWDNKELENKFQPLLRIREALNAANVGKENVISLPPSHPALDVLSVQELCEIWQVANVVSGMETKETLKVGDEIIGIDKTDNFCCPRCRLYLSQSEDELCSRCESVIESLC